MIRSILPGHSSPKTSELYAQVSTRIVKDIKSPVEMFKYSILRCMKFHGYWLTYNQFGNDRLETCSDGNIHTYISLNMCVCRLANCWWQLQSDF
jgi:hypothetical protein